jgi:ATP-dependent RNA helicase RhlE
MVPREVPDERAPFTTLDLHPTVLAGVEDRGFADATPIQTAVIPLARAGGDVIACAETGTGKTAAFVLPLLDRLVREREAGDNATTAAPRIRVLVLTPTRELAVQVEDEVQGFSYHAHITSAAVYGGVPMGPQSQALDAGVPIVVATPGRLMDHMRTNPTLLSGVEVLVLDEADRMLDMGFWPDVRRITDALSTTRQTLLFSATMPEEVMRYAQRLMREPAFVQVGHRNGAARTITHEVQHVPAGEKTRWLMKFLRSETGPILVFVRTKHGAERLARQLATSGLRATALHADRDQKQRSAAVEGFRAGKYRVLVATDIAARGLDVEGITHVVNYDVPRTGDDYVHRVGRTGRALATGTAVTLVCPGDERALQVISRHLPAPGSRPSAEPLAV